MHLSRRGRDALTVTTEENINLFLASSGQVATASQGALFFYENSYVQATWPYH